MTIYRVEERRWSPIRLVAAGLLILLIAGGIWWWRVSSAPVSGNQAGEAARALREAAQGLEVFLIEYPQSAQGVERAGALSVLERAHAALRRAQPSLAAQDPALADELEAEFQTLRRLAEQQASPEEILPRTERLRDRLLSLSAPAP